MYRHIAIRSLSDWAERTIGSKRLGYCARALLRFSNHFLDGRS